MNAPVREGRIKKSLLELALRTTWPWLVCIAAFISWCCAAAYAGEAVRVGSGLATLSCTEQPLTPSSADAMQQTEANAAQPFAFAAWHQVDVQRAECTALGRAQTVSVLYVRGDSTLVLPLSARLAEGDAAGCLMDSDTAYRLFGDVNAAGGMLELNGRSYVIRDVFDAPEATILLWAGTLNAPLLDQINLDVTSQADPRRAAEQFMMRHGLQPSVVTLQQGYGSWAHFFARLPLWGMGIAAVALLLREARARRTYPVQQLVLFLLASIVALLWLWAAEWRFQLPQELLPTRWSDFSFWQRVAERYRSSLLQTLYSKKNAPDVLLLGLVGRATAFGIAGLALFLTVRRRIVAQTCTGLFVAAATLLLGAFAGLWLASGTGFSLPQTRAIWVTPALYLLIASLARHLHTARTADSGKELVPSATQTPSPSNHL